MRLAGRIVVPADKICDGRGGGVTIHHHVMDDYNSLQDMKQLLASGAGSATTFHDIRQTNSCKVPRNL